MGTRVTRPSIHHMPQLIKSICGFMAFYSLAVVLVVFLYSLACVAFSFSSWIDSKTRKDRNP